MKSLIAIRHIDFEDLEIWKSFLSKEYEIKYIDAIDPNISLLKNDDIDLLFIFRKSIGTY